MSIPAYMKELQKRYNRCQCDVEYDRLDVKEVYWIDFRDIENPEGYLDAYARGFCRLCGKQAVRLLAVYSRAALGSDLINQCINQLVYKYGQRHGDVLKVIESSYRYYCEMYGPMAEELEKYL
jgi:hypothetical protein